MKGRLFKLDAMVDVTAEWKKEVRNFTTFSLQLKAPKAARVDAVHWFAGEWRGADEKVVQRTRLQDNVLFLRKGKVSFFISANVRLGVHCELEYYGAAGENSLAIARGAASMRPCPRGRSRLAIASGSFARPRSVESGA